MAASSLLVPFSWPAMVHLPPIKCSFPTNQHPEYDAHREAEAEARWVLSRFGGLDSSLIREARLRQSRFHLLTSLAYANGLAERMGPIYQFVAWFFLVDNLVDDLAELSARPKEAAALLANIEGALEQPPSDDVQATADVDQEPSDLDLQLGAAHDEPYVLAQIAREWWASMRRLGMPPAQQARFVRLFQAYVRGALLKVAHRRDGHLPGPAAYLRLRDGDGGWHVCRLLLEFGLAIDFDSATVNHPLMRRLAVAAARHVHLFNDLYSFAKEYREGDLFNMVTVLFVQKKNLQFELEQQCRQQPHSSSADDEQLLHEAIEEVAGLVQEKDEECVRLMESIRQCPTLMDQPGMALYLEGIGNWLAGNVHWHLVSARYGISSASLAASLSPSTE